MRIKYNSFFKAGLALLLILTLTSRAWAYKAIQEEREMGYYIVEQEACGLSYEHKQIIMWVIDNRRRSRLFNYRTLKDVMTAKKQFTSLTNYYSKKCEPTPDTIRAVDSVLNAIESEDLNKNPESGDIASQSEIAVNNSKGALFFYHPIKGRRIKFFENREFLFELEGHRFFK